MILNLTFKRIINLYWVAAVMLMLPVQALSQSKPTFDNSTAPGGVYGSIYGYTILTNDFEADARQIDIISGTLPNGLTFTDNGDGTAAISGAALEAGNFPIKLRVSETLDQSQKDTKDITISISKATLTVSANNKNRAYGSANPTLSISYSGFLNGDDSSDLDTAPAASTAAIITSPVTTYPITVADGLDDNYDFDYVSGTLTITKAMLIVTADNKSKTYGSANPTLTITYSGFLNGDDEGDLDTPPTASTIATITSPIATYPITVASGSDNNYDFTYADGTLTVTRVTLTVTADDKSREYGSSNPTLTISYSGFLNGDDLSDIDTPPTATTTATIGSSVATYSITLAGGSDDNYDFIYVSGTLTITKATLTVTADSKSRAYGSANPTLTISYSGFLNGDDSSDLDTPPTAATTATITSPIATYPITVAGGSDNNYDFTYVQGTLTITRVAITATADNKSRAYGSPNPTLTISYSGFLNGDDLSDLDTPPTATTTATIGSPVATYSITVAGGSDDNYDFIYVPGLLTVTKATLTANADDQSRAYGSANPTLTISYSGFVNGETSSEINTLPTATTGATTTSPVATYPITVAGGSDDNYDFTYAPGTLTITKVTLTVTADDKSRVYGAANPTFTVSYSGFVNGDSPSVINTKPTASTTATSSSPLGLYPITVSGGLDDNYDFIYVAGTLTIGKTVLIATANNQSRAYGSSNPTLTISYSGFLNGDDSSDLDTAPTATTTAAIGSPLGTYPITVAGGSDDNYDFTYVSGTLTITKATLTVTVDNESRAYGSSNPTLTISYGGFVNGDDASDLNTAPTATTTATISSPVTTYPITVSGGSDDNYAFTYVNGTLTITKVTLTVTANDQSRPYLSSNPIFTITYTGFVNSENSGVLNTLPTATTTATSASSVGIYPIVVTSGVDNNYSFNYINGLLTITKITPVITWPAPSPITYGTALSSLQLNASSATPGLFAYSPAGGTILNTGANQVLTVDFTPSDLTNYNSVNGKTVLITVNKATPSITWTTPSPIKVNQPLTSLQLNATSSTAGSFIYTPPIGTSFSSIGVYTLSVDFVPANLSNFNVVSNVQVQLAVSNRDNPVITWNNPAAITYGTALSSSQLNATANVPGTLTYSPALGTILAAGANQLLSVKFIPSDQANYNVIESFNVIITVNKASLTATAKNESRPYGSPNPIFTVIYNGFVNGDTKAKLDTNPIATTSATANSAVGNYDISVSGGIDNNYSFVYASGSLVISKATLTTIAANHTRFYGTPNPSLTIIYNGFLNDDSVNDIDTPPIATTTATASSVVGTYSITVAGGADNNYNFNYVPGTLTVTPNFPPSLFDFQIETTEDQTWVVTYADFGNNFSSFSGSPITTVKIVSLPVNGTILWKGNVISVGQSVTVQNGLIDNLVYVPNLNYHGFDSFKWNASDGVFFAQNDALVTIRISSVNDPPVLSNIESEPIEYSLGDPAVQITSKVLISDIDNNFIHSAKILIAENFFNGDRLSLSFSVSPFIVATFNPTIGELVLTGKDSKSNYEMTIAQVSFSSPVSGVAGDKKIVITVNDSTSNSLPTSRIVRILEIFPEVDIVNSFTPNDDGVNDYWDFVNLEYYSKIIISVFDRNGFKVYSCFDENCKWDGKMNGKELPAGTYYYTIDLNDGKRKYQGAVTILK